MSDRREPRNLSELNQLDDDAYVTTPEAAAFLVFSVDTLIWYRKRRPDASPKFYRVGARSIRYRMGDLRAFCRLDPKAYLIPRSVVCLGG